MRLNLSLFVVMLAAILAGCGGSGTSVSVPGAGRLSAPVMLPLGGKMVSGVPQGIYVTWTRNTEPEAAGYYLYRDVNPIPTPPPDETINPALRVNGGNQIPQPPSGPDVAFTDIFTVTVGQTYYYRVTVVDTEGTESYPSNEMSWTVLGQTVTGLSPTSAFWGDEITLDGTIFGTYEPTTDHVLFQTAGGNTLEGAVTSWNDTQIKAQVPDDTITGPVYVVIAGTIAATDDDLNILNPYLTSISPQVGYVEQTLSIFGNNFGVSQGSSIVKIGTSDVSSTVTAWSNTQIDILPPDGVVQANVRVTVNGLTSNGIFFRPKTEILTVSRTSAAPGAEITIDGRYFGATGGTVTLGGLSEPVTLWDDRQIKFTVTRDPGTYPLTVARYDGVVSNDVPFTMLETPTVTISGIDPLHVYTPTDEPTITINFPIDTDSLEVYAGNRLIYQQLTAPLETAVTLNVLAIQNGSQPVKVRIQARSIETESNILDGKFYGLPGDVDGNGIVDAADLDALRSNFGMQSGDPGYGPWLDTDGNGLVNEADASAIGYGFGDQTLTLSFP